MYSRNGLLSTALSILIVVVISCSRDPHWGGASFGSGFNTSEKPVLEINVAEYDPIDFYGPSVDKCKVKIYTSEQDLLQDANSIDSGLTNYKGSVSFRLDSSRYWFRCKKDCKTNELFNVQTSREISRNHPNREFVTITEYTNVNFRNKTSIDYYVYAVYGEKEMYIDHLQANGELIAEIISSANSLLLKSSSQYPIIKKNYPVKLDCLSSKFIEVL